MRKFFIFVKESVTELMHLELSKLMKIYSNVF